MSQSHGASLWREPAGSGAAPPVQGIVFRLLGAKWTPIVSDDAEAKLLDVPGTGKYVLTDVRAGDVPAAAEALLILVRSKVLTY